MKSVDDVERLLHQTPLPCVVEGPHREELKQRLLAQPPSTLQEEKKMGASMYSRMSPALKVAAAVLAVALLVGAGWAAEKIYEKLTFTQASLTLEQYPIQEWTLPSGKKLTTSNSTTVTTVDPDDPQAIETAQRHYEEMKGLITARKYEFVKTLEDRSDGTTQYVYRFTLSDGTHIAQNFSMPLDDVASWDDYQQKDQRQSREYREQVDKAIAAGRYRLINEDVILLHICLDRASQEKFRVQRIPLAKGQEIALYRPYDIVEDAGAAMKPESSWQEHLQAIRDGKLELLGVETTPSYTYEVVFDDGTKRIFSYGGGKPLKAPASE